MSVFVYLKNFIYIVFGCLLAAFGTGIFLLPAKLSCGGFSGIATVIYYLFDFKVGYTIMILNIPLFIYSILKMGKGFTIKSIFATIIYSCFIDLFSIKEIVINDMFLACVYGGILIGVGLALVLKANASTGGTDLVAHIMLDKHINAKISSVIMIIDIIVVFINLMVFKGIEIGLYSFIVIWIIGKIIDIVFEGINYCKIVYIITENDSQISKKINDELKRGVTKIYAKGSFTEKNKIILMCICKRYDVENIKKIARKIDKNSFIVISDAREVFGLGFKT